MKDGVAKLIGVLILVAAVGLGTWGSYAIGHALNMYGTVGFLAGAGIIAGGLLVVAAVAAVGYSLVSGCMRSFRNMRNNYRARVEAQERQRPSLDNRDTRSIHRGLGNHPAQPQPSSSLTIEYDAPPSYQQPASAVAAQASAPPAPDYSFTPQEYGARP